LKEIEAVSPVDILRRAGIEVETVGLAGKIATGAHGIAVQTDREIGEAAVGDAEMLILPGGGGGVESMNQSEKCLELIRAFAGSGKLIAAICAAPTVLASMGILKGLRAVVYPGLEHKLESAGAHSPARRARNGRIIIISPRRAGFGPSISPLNARMRASAAGMYPRRCATTSIIRDYGAFLLPDGKAEHAPRLP
jgi:putative intracellular protease/amidase